MDRYAKYAQPYGDLTKLNRSRRILDAVGRDMLQDIVSDYLDTLNTSAAIYEADGSYAVGIFSSGWCRMMDSASRNLCGDVSDISALSSGKWLCHESCWDASRRSIETGKPTEAETDGVRGCHGGIFIYAVPIYAFDEPIGSINFGYGHPPADRNTLVQLSQKYKVPLEQMDAVIASNQVATEKEVDLSKVRLITASRLIGALVERYEAQRPDRNMQKLDAIIESLKR